MKNINKRQILLILLTIMIMGSCCQDNIFYSHIELNPTLTEQLVADVELIPGISVDSINLKNGSDWKYAVSVPEQIDSTKVPLIIALHWADSGNEFEPYLRCQAEPGLKNTNAIIFAPDARGVNWWEGENPSMIMTFVEYAKNTWPIDENKIVVTGYSNGGIGTWHFGIEHPDIFSAAIPVGSTTEHDKKLTMPFYVIQGENDTGFDDLEQRVDALNKLGSDIEFHIAPRLTHFMACGYSVYLQNAADWLINDVWKEEK